MRRKDMIYSFEPTTPLCLSHTCTYRCDEARLPHHVHIIRSSHRFGTAAAVLLYRLLNTLPVVLYLQRKDANLHPASSSTEYNGL